MTPLLKAALFKDISELIRGQVEYYGCVAYTASLALILKSVFEVNMFLTSREILTRLILIRTLPSVLDMDSSYSVPRGGLQTTGAA